MFLGVMPVVPEGWGAGWDTSLLSQWGTKEAQLLHGETVQDDFVLGGMNVS